MAGLTTNYQLSVIDKTNFFDSMVLFTSRYEPKKNYLALYPNVIDIETNIVFVNTVLQKINTKILLYTNHSAGFNPSNLLPLPQAVKQIQVDGGDIQAVFARLFDHAEIGFSELSAMTNPFAESTRCLNFCAKLTPDISPAQRGIITAFAEPYVRALTENMAPCQILPSLDQAHAVITRYVNPKACFKLLMRNTFIYHESSEPTSTTNPTIAIIDTAWDKDIQEKVLSALYKLGCLLAGKADLENALIEASNTLPNLQTQQQLIDSLFEPAQG